MKLCIAFIIVTNILSCLHACTDPKFKYFEKTTQKYTFQDMLCRSSHPETIDINILFKGFISLNFMKFCEKNNIIIIGSENLPIHVDDKMFKVNQNSAEHEPTQNEDVSLKVLRGQLNYCRKNHVQSMERDIKKDERYAAIPAT